MLIIESRQIFILTQVFLLEILTEIYFLYILNKKLKDTECQVYHLL